MSADLFRSVWLKRLNLEPTDWRRSASAHLESCPFVLAEHVLRLVEFLLEQLPSRAARAHSAGYGRVADAFGWLCTQAWQSASHFPAFAENYANRLLVALKAKRLPADAPLIADFILSDGSAEYCGFQRLDLANADFIRRSEVWLRAGEFEPFLRARKKYDEFAQRLRDEPGFRRDWRTLRHMFPRETASRGILHRTLIPERNWVRDGGAKFRTRAQRFQACFDLLCWKYCLWGVGRGRPLLLKPSVVLTPHGTQIFIPAYLSFDAKRDLNLGLITKLHRARGIARQGEKLSTQRLSAAAQRRIAAAADREARTLKLRGAKRYAHISQRLGWLDHGDYRQIRRLLARSPR